jgi:hypothetical protein
MLVENIKKLYKISKGKEEDNRYNELEFIKEEENLNIGDIIEDIMFDHKNNFFNDKEISNYYYLGDKEKFIADNNIKIELIDDNLKLKLFLINLNLSGYDVHHSAIFVDYTKELALKKASKFNKDFEYKNVSSIIELGIYTNDISKGIIDYPIIVDFRNG